MVWDRSGRHCRRGGSSVDDAAGDDKTLFAPGTKTRSHRNRNALAMGQPVARIARHEVIVANSRNVQLVSKNRQKDERNDARTLARLARFDKELRYPIRHRSQTTQAHLELLRARNVLVAVRTKIVNHLRGATKPFGVRLPRCSPSAMVKKAPAAIPPELQAAMHPLLDLIKNVSAQIAAYDRQIERLADLEYSESRALR